MKKQKILRYFSSQRGFTFIELILYVTILTIIITALTPFAWSMVQGGTKVAVQQEVYSQARFVSERIKREIRNALGINSFSSTSITLCETSGSCATNPTIITFSAPNVTIQDKGAAAVNLNSNDVRITNFSFTNYTSGDNKTKHIGFTFTISDNYSSTRQEYQESIDIRSSAELRSN